MKITPQMQRNFNQTGSWFAYLVHERVFNKELDDFEVIVKEVIDFKLMRDSQDLTDQYYQDTGQVNERFQEKN